MSANYPFTLRLKEARVAANLSQKDLGILIGIEPSSASGRMNHYEKGRHLPDIQTLKRLSEALDVPLSYFFCESEEMAELVKLINQLDKEKQIQLIKKIREFLE